MGLRQRRMGGLTQRWPRQRDLGVEIRCNADVTKSSQDDRVRGIVLKDGSGTRPCDRQQCRRPHHISKLLIRSVARRLAAAIERSVTTALAQDQCGAPSCPTSLCLGAAAHIIGERSICPDQDYIERAFDDAKYGIPSKNPILECTIPSVVDPSVAPAGRHLMSMFIQYAPYKLKGATWDELRDPFADRCFDLLNEYAPNFKRSVIARQVLTPLDLERTFNLTGGNICQGAMPLHQLFACRPVPGFADYRTPIRGLYLCGAAAHPGGGVMGAAGANAARAILKHR